MKRPTLSASAHPFWRLIMYNETYNNVVASLAAIGATVPWDIAFALASAACSRQVGMHTEIKQFPEHIHANTCS